MDNPLAVLMPLLYHIFGILARGGEFGFAELGLRFEFVDKSIEKIVILFIIYSSYLVVFLLTKTI